MPLTPADFRRCSPAEATFVAYLKTVFPPSDLIPGRENPHPVSGALLRARLINALECGGAVALDELTGEIAFTYADSSFPGYVETAVPLTNPHPLCGTCGQWEREHGNPNPTACDRFDVTPRPGTADNPLCLAEDCGGYPRTHHGRPYAVACSHFES
ncbi:hypothetical protein EF903_05470 [Streptomyces sp. WAC05292]|uniref:hypothetical protein n=1 Tax=Streptomyces sp. WAC05292 TaxID=2487418 RepID=UPI000F73A607|nr:hypothetical protein [Streptomyces sp. WAC05292]RSS95090.1 hypothetical protein EF903_05470 [Streptomyces sp. WAC05292]